MRNYRGRITYSRKERAALGLCLHCQELSAPQKTSCLKHLKDASENRAKHRKKLIQKGLCGTCGSTPTDGGRLCDNCREYLNNRLKNRIEKGLCTRCAFPAQSERRTCDACTTIARDYAKKNRPSRSDRFFLAALEQVKSTRNGRREYGASSTTATDLLELWKRQRGICALSGVRLSRENSEVDHILPASKGGSNDIENLRWAQKDANRAKQALTDEEFLNLCKRVVKYFEVKQ